MQVSSKHNSSPIVILGFGRSGTTWLSDIVSKAVGGLILFEPFHPAVFPDSNSFCYASDLKKHPKFIQFVTDTLSKNNRNKWLIRNHVGPNLNDISPAFIDMTWDHNEVIGFKSIRANHIINNIYNSITHKIVYILRHPCAVLSSIRNRKRFWEEYGWDFHKEIFFDRSLNSSQLSEDERQYFINNISKIKDDLTYQAAMWTLSQIIAIRQLNTLGLPIFHYEDFYQNPYNSTRNLLTYLGQKDIRIHPSYIFTPSMLTLRTAHSYRKTNEGSFDTSTSVFWQDILSAEEEHLIKGKVKEIVSRFPDVEQQLALYL